MRIKVQVKPLRAPADAFLIVGYDCYTPSDWCIGRLTTRVRNASSMPRRERRTFRVYRVYP